MVKRVATEEHIGGALNNELETPKPFEHLARHAHLTPSAIALATEHRDFTYQQLLRQVKGIAGVLRDAGVQAGDIVVSQVKTDLHLAMMQALFHEAVIGCGYPSQVDVDNPVGFDWFVSHQYSPTFPAEKTIIIDDSFMLDVTTSPREIDHRTYDDFSSLCRLRFSSGTTGSPIAIPFTVGHLEGHTRTVDEQWMSLRPVMSLMTIQNGLGFTCAYSNMRNGDKYIAPGSAAKNLSQIKRNYVAAVIGSPTQLSELVNEAKKTGARLDDLVRLISAGSYLPLQLVDRIMTISGATILNSYGSTETGMVAWQDTLSRDATDVGEILGNVEVQIVDEDDRLVPPGETGFIRWRCEFMAQSYFRDAKDHVGGLRNGWFYSGDLGSVSVDNHLHLAGRMSEMINAGGVKIDPSKVDAAIQASGLVHDVCTFAYQRNEGLVGFGVAIVPSPGFDLGTLKTLIAQECRNVKPHAIVEVNSIARNQAGKVLRAEMAKNCAVIWIKLQLMRLRDPNVRRL